MKPIIIGITKDRKVDMTFEEFQKHMRDAYDQGYSDRGTYLLSSTTGSGRWWEDVTYCNSANTTKATIATAINSTEG